MIDDAAAEPFVFAPDLLESIGLRLITLRNFHLGSYKESYVRRRLSIRIKATGCQSPEQYHELLTSDEGELDELLKVLNVHVSQFFRNPQTFTKLCEEVLPELLQVGREESRMKVAIWSVGCASGEEPYSLALLIRHFFPEQAQRVSIVGTDIDPHILATASAASFRSERLIDLPEEMRSRYFIRKGARHQLVDEIREMVCFRQADLFHPDSFIPSDLILCRNVLIYFQPWQQERIVSRFADVLRPGGFLVLGNAETLSGHGRHCFEPSCPTDRIYRRLSR